MLIWLETPESGNVKDQHILTPNSSHIGCIPVCFFMAFTRKLSSISFTRILSSWLNYILGNNATIIAYMLGCDFSMLTVTTVLFTSHYLQIYEHVTQPLPLNLPFVNETQI